MPGTYKFTWGHPAEEVYVTGEFDNWTKSEKLEKVGSSFEKVVTLPDATKKIYYKFVVDNNWVTDHTAPQEPDHEGNVNNFLTPEQIIKEGTSSVTPAAAVMNTVTPEATTAALAKDVPLENKKDEVDDKPTPTDAPGGFPETPADELNKPVGISPLPATDVTKPSTTLAPGEPLPASAKAGDINAAVTLDKESYEKSDRLPGLSGDETKLPEVDSSTIPESSLPMPAAAIAAASINTVTPEATTAALAAEVPKDAPKVPETVKDSQDKAQASPEASADPVEVGEKAAVEEELKEKVPEAPSTAEGTSGFGTEKSEKAGIAATAVTAGGIAAAAAVAAKDAIVGKSEPAVTEASKTASDYAGKAQETATDATNQATVAATEAAAQLPEGVKQQLPEQVQEAIKTQKQEETLQEVAPNVPAEVKESLAEAQKNPEAAGSALAVEDKKDVESELLKEVKPVPAVGEEKTKTEEVKEETKAAIKNEPTETPKETLANDKAESSTAATATNGATPAAAAAPTAEKKDEPATPAKAEASQANNSTPASTTTTEKKKKNRLSAFIGKIKSKVHKD